jgi:hypothetical protein
VIVVGLFVFRETREIVELASAVDPRLGRAVLFALLAVYAICLGVPLVMILRLPRPLTPPSGAGPAELERYYSLLARRLSRNPGLAGVDIRADRASLEAALAVLHARARTEMTTTASMVFLSTAVSQSGRLDGLMVLLAQSRMVWRIAHLYAQRPSWRELGALYANVATTVFLVRSVDDIELEEIVEPVLAPVIAGSALGAIPGFAGVANLVMESALQGGFNAFLTLRVGCVTSLYCRALVAPERRALRRSATAEAASLLPGIVVTGASKVSSAIVRAARRATIRRKAPPERASFLSRFWGRRSAAPPLPATVDTASPPESPRAEPSG